MAYFRTLKNNERTLVYTAKDRQIQEQRKHNPHRGYWQCTNNRQHLSGRAIRRQIASEYERSS